MFPFTPDHYHGAKNDEGNDKHKIHMDIVTPILCKLHRNALQGIKMSTERWSGPVFQNFEIMYI